MRSSVQNPCSLIAARSWRSLGGVMALPPLYKYLDVQGAKLTLGNNTFKHAKPSDFNDTEDMTIQSIFPEDVEAALMTLSSGFTDVILKNLNEPPTCDSAQMRENVALIQRIYRENPEAADAVKEQISKDPIGIFDVCHMRAVSQGFVEEINEFMQGYRVLCVTTHKDSEQMWVRYAQNHEGISLRIHPNAEKDSKFQLFRPIEYRASRPPLYDDTLDFLEGSMIGDQQSKRLAMLDKIIYSKTLEWEHENEYRLVIPAREGEKEWDTLPYHPEEIPELFLGLAMTQDNADDIVAKTRALNPSIAIARARRDGDDKLVFDKL